MAFLKCFNGNKYFIDEQNLTALFLRKVVVAYEAIPEEEVKLLVNGKFVQDDEIIPPYSSVQAVLSLDGGKGGFGSMLRAIGAQIEKTTNREACRDLSGRRLRDINEENRLKRWISKQAEREKEKAKRRQERLERMCAVPKHQFESSAYDKQRTDILESIDDAITQGLQTGPSEPGPSSSKRKAEEPSVKSKKTRLWGDIDDLLDAEASSDENESDETKNDSKNLDSDSSSNAEDLSSLDKLHKDEKPNILLNEEKCKTSDGNKKTKYEGKIENTATVPEKLDLMQFTSCEELEKLGMERLKSALVALKMKCGGTLEQRAERLWSVRGIEEDKISSHLLAKPSKK